MTDRKTQDSISQLGNDLGSCLLVPDHDLELEATKGKDPRDCSRVVNVAATGMLNTGCQPRVIKLITATGVGPPHYFLSF